MTNSSNNWATILAGGEGRRLRTLTRALSGDARPKQFCRLLGQRTLLDETRRRVYMNVEPARTVYVVTRDHEAFYRPELSDVRRWQLIEQPTNRGTTAAVIYTLVRLRALGAEGVVGLFPADHYYTDRLVLQRTVADAYTFADSHPDSVVLLGAEADRPETDYGWIEPGRAIGADARRLGRPLARLVSRFCEKPSADMARDLLARGCLWNTLVLVGRIEAFEALVEETVGPIWRRFGSLREVGTPEEELLAAEEVYGDLGS